MVTNALACEPGDPQPCDPTSTHQPGAAPHGHQDLRRHRRQQAGRHGVLHGPAGQRRRRRLHRGRPGRPGRRPDRRARRRDLQRRRATPAQGPAPTYAAPRITWSGPLAAGDEVRVTYEVVLKGGGDGEVDNVGWAPPDPGDPGPTPDCADRHHVPCDERVVRPAEADDHQGRRPGRADGDRPEGHLHGRRSPTRARATTPPRTRRRSATTCPTCWTTPTFDPVSITATSARRRSPSRRCRWSRRARRRRGRDDHLHGHLPRDRRPRLDNTACVPAAEARTPAERVRHAPRCRAPG